MSLSFEELKALNEDIRRMYSHRQDQPFTPQSPMTGEEYTKSFLQAAAKYKISSLNMGKACVTEESVSWLADNLREITELKELSLNGAKAGPKAVIKLLNALKESKTERLDISQNAVNGDKECTDAVLGIIGSGKIKSLTINSNTMAEPFFERLAPLLETAALEKLSCQSVGAAYGGDELGNALAKSSLKHLDISYNPKISQSALQAVAKNLPASKLEFFSAHFIELNEETAVEMCKGLTESNVKETVLTFASGGMDAERRVSSVIADMFSSHQTRLEKAVCELKNWDDRNRKPIFNARMEQMHRIAFREAYRKKVEYAADLPLMLADTLAQGFDTGLLPKVLAVHKAPLSAKECLEPTCDGKTFIENAAAAELLPEIFVKNKWKDAKEMQTAWNAVPEADKWQLDGRHGRPSFQKIKNEVMRSAVTDLLLKNKGKGSK